MILRKPVIVSICILFAAACSSEPEAVDPNSEPVFTDLESEPKDTVVPQQSEAATQGSNSAETTEAMIAGLWAPGDVGCSSGLFVDLDQSGSFATFESRGTWSVENERLRFATTMEGSPPDPMTPVSPAKITYVELSEVSQNSAIWNGNTDYADSMVRCPPSE